MAQDQNSVIFTNRNKDLLVKEEPWKLIYNSYVGGTDYYDAGYLVRYPKESINSYEKRKERACYFNQVSPIVDMLSGLLFLNEPTRKIPNELEFLREKASKDKSLNDFMRVVAAYSIMFTCGVLVDSPSFDSEVVKTEADRINMKLNPYAVLYLPFKIRDFYVGENFELEWVILDNSYFEHSDPFQSGEEVKEYRLWTKTYYQDFRYNEEDNSISTNGKISHNCGQVPFRFVSWRDDNNDFIAETIFEDISRVTKLIYNSMSYMDEMLASGTFKMLIYPTSNGEIPVELSGGGVGALSIVPYQIDSNTQPGFIGASLSDIDPFIKAMEFYMAEILKKVGLSTDETKEFVKSGVAKRIDFQKMRALLVSGASAMAKLEKWIFEVAAKWQNSSRLPEAVEYNTAFSSEDLELEVRMLTELLVHPIQSLRQNVLQLLVKKLLSNSLDDSTLNTIYEDIGKNLKNISLEEGGTSLSVPELDKLVNRKNTNSSN